MDRVFATTAGYPCIYTPTIMSGPVFRWREAARPDVGMEISASRDCVMLQHGSVMSHDRSTIPSLFSVVNLAVEVHEMLSCDDSSSGVQKAKDYIMEKSKEQSKP